MTQGNSKLSRILYVDDDIHITELVQMAFRHFENIEAMVCNDGHSALAVVDSYRPQLIMLDVRMPIMDGLELLSRLLELKLNVPMILTTAAVSQEELSELEVAGAFAIITKPFTPSSLTSQVIAIWNKWHQEERF